MAEDGRLTSAINNLAQSNKEIASNVGNVIKDELGDTFKPFADQITAPFNQLKAGIEALPGMKFTKKMFGAVTAPLKKANEADASNASADAEQENEKRRYETSTQMLFESIRDGIYGIQDGLINGLAGLKDKGLLGLGILAGLVAAPFAAIAAFFSQIALEVKFLSSLVARMKEGRVFKAIAGFIDLITDSIKTGFRTLLPKDYIANWKAGALKALKAPLDLIKAGLNTIVGPETKIGGLATAMANTITKIKNTFNPFYTATDTATDAFKQGPFMRRLIGIQERFTKGIANVRSFFGAVGRNVGSLARGVQTVIDMLPGFKPIVDFAKGLGKVLGKIFFPIGFLMTAYDVIKGAIAGYEEGGFLGGLEGAVTGLFNSLVGMPLDLLKSAVAWALGKLGFDETAEAVSSFSFSTIISDTVGGIFDFIKSAFNWVGTLFTDPVTALKELWTGLVGEGGFIDLITTPFNLAVDWLLGIFGWSDPEGEDFNLLKIVKDTVGDIIDWFKGIFDIDMSNVVKSIPGAESILKALGILEETPQEKARNIEAAIAEAQERIARSEGGENVYFGRDRVGREEDAAEIAEMQKELELLRAGGAGTVVINNVDNSQNSNAQNTTLTTQALKDTSAPAGTVPAFAQF